MFISMKLAEKKDVFESCACHGRQTGFSTLTGRFVDKPTAVIQVTDWSTRRQRILNNHEKTAL